MKTVSVCIISEQFLPNYLFLVEKAKETDEILLIVSKAFEIKAEYGMKQLQTLGKKIGLLVLSAEDVEEDWGRMIEEITGQLAQDCKYLVNLTGGTKYMAMAVQKAFEGFKTECFYIPLPKNYIIKPMQSDDHYREPIKHRVSVEECLRTFGVEIVKTYEPLCDFATTKRCFELFVTRKLSRRLEDLRKAQSRISAKSVVEQIPVAPFEAVTTNVENIKNFLKDLNDPIYAKALTKADISYLRGRWFNEHLYYLVKNHVKPEDIAFNVAVNAPLADKNEIIKTYLDLCFVRNNKLFVLGSRVFNNNKAPRENDLIYKSKAIKETILGSSAISIICAIGAYIGNRGASMGIECYDTDYFRDPRRFQVFIDDIIKRSN
jgi:hypothetical protein